MNGFQSSKDCSLQKPFPGCLGGVVSLFELSASGSGRKLLTDKPHFNGSTLLRTHRDDGMMSETPDETEIEDKMIISESRRSSPKRSPNCTPMKMLIAQEMLKEIGSKDGPPNVVAKLMGLDAMPSRHHSPDPLKSRLKGCARHYEKSASTWTEEQTYLERQMRNKDCKMQKKNDRKDVYEVQRISRGPDFIQGISTPRGRSNETMRADKMAFVRQKFLEAKRLATNEKLLKSKEFQDAVDVLSSNSDVFLKLLQEPNTKLSRNMNELQSLCASSAPKRITVLRPSKMVTNNRFCSTIMRNEEPVDEPRVLTQEASCPRSIPANFSPTDIHQNCDLYVSQQPTRIVVLKPSFRQSDGSNPATSAPMTSSSKLIQSDVIHVDEDTDARTSEEIVREITHYTHESILHQRMNESLLSSAMPNGYGISCGSPFENLDEIPVEAFSDPEVTSPASRRSWDIMNSFDSPLSTSSLSRASYSPDSSVCREAKKRLSERWTVMASNGKCQAERRLRKSSSTLGEMLALSDPKLSNEKQEHYECKVDEPRMSASCLKTSLSGEEFAESLKCLSRSKSMPLSSTLSGDRMHLRSISPDSCQRDVKDSTRAKGVSSFKGIVSKIFSTRNKRITRVNASKFRFANESQLLATENAESSEYIVNGVPQRSSTPGTNRQEDNPSSHFRKGAPDKTSLIPVDVILNGSAVAERPGTCVSRSPLTGSGANQEQPCVVSVLNPICEDDSSTTADHSWKGLTSSSLRCNLIDKSPPIGSISRTLSGDYSRKSEPPYTPKPSLMFLCAKEEEQELPVYIQRLLSSIAFGTNDDTNSTDISRWHSPNCPLDPTILNKFPDEEDDEDRQPLHEVRKRIRRSNRKLVFDCVNAALLRNVGFDPVGFFKVEDRGIDEGPLIMGDRIWGRIKDWFSSEVSSVCGYDEDDCIMTVDRVARDEVVGKGWLENSRMEVENVVREIGVVMLQELVYEALVDLTGN